MYLIIDYGLCEGCGGCAEAFPLFFEMRDDRAWVTNADKFVPEENPGVLTICPYNAISVEKCRHSTRSSGNEQTDKTQED